MKTNYRPEIDGLRAIAVGGVILYHTQKSFFGYQIFPGGYLGVNIFFVISGYLITSIILNELIQTDSFSFKNFYIRRIRRILPALLFVILTSLPVAWLYLIPNIYRVYPDKLFCNNRLANRCVANDQDNLFYYDDDHLSLKGSELLVNEIMKIINLIINKK